jgi:hypothetical protein
MEEVLGRLLIELAALQPEVLTAREVRLQRDLRSLARDALETSQRRRLSVILGREGWEE